MHSPVGLGMQTAKRVQFYSYGFKLRKKVNSEIWNSPGSRQLLQPQPFPKIFKILDPSFIFIWPGIVCFPEICHSSAINFDLLKSEVRPIVSRFE